MWVFKAVYKWLELDGYTLYGKQHRQINDGSIIVRNANIADYVTLSRLNYEIFEDDIEIKVTDIVGKNTFIYMALQTSSFKPIGLMSIVDCGNCVVIQRMGVLRDYPNREAVYYRLMSMIAAGVKIGGYVDRQHANHDDLCKYFENSGFTIVGSTPCYHYYETC